YNEKCNSNLTKYVHSFCLQTNSQTILFVTKPMIVIITNAVVMSIALNLKHIMIDLGFKVFIKTFLTDYDCDNDDFLYIIIHNPTNRNPKKYVHYQIEQSTSNWFTPQYMFAMKNSINIWEFAKPNIQK